MELQGLLRRKFELLALAWRSISFIVLLVGALLPCSSLAVAATNPCSFPVAQQASLDSATSNTTAADEPEVSDQDRRIKRRLLTVALVGGVLLSLLAFGYGYLRLELTTRGFYSGRLQIAAGIASISTLTAAYFLWRWLIN